MLIEYLGTFLAISGQSVRAICPKRIASSFVLSGLAGIILGTYTFLTAQWGLVFLNVWAFVMSVIGLYKWHKVEIGDKGDEKNG